MRDQELTGMFPKKPSQKYICFIDCRDQSQLFSHYHSFDVQSKFIIKPSLM